MTLEQALAEIEELHARLEEAEEGLDAIRSGEVDAVVVTGPEGEQIYTLTGAERTYRVLVEAMNEGALVLSLEGSILYCNRAFAAMLNAPIYDVLGHSVYEFVADDDVRPLKEMLRHAPLRADRREIELKRNGTDQIPASISVGHLETDEGTSVSAVVTDLTEHRRTEAELELYREHLEALVLDRTRELFELNEQLKDEIHDRKEAEESLRESEERFRAMADSTPIMIWVTNAEGDVQFVNSAYREFFGVTPEETVGPRWQPLVYPDDAENYITLFHEALRNRQPFRTRARVRRYDGQWRWIDSHGAPRFSASGEFIGMAGSSPDITDQVHYEQQRQELYERERHISEMLQQALIPPEVPYSLNKLSIAARYRPALREAEVGGDFYDIFDLDDHTIGVLIGDVAGKGLQAAISVAAIRYSVRSYAYIDPSPSKVMTLANDALCRENPDADSLLTAFFAVVDTQSGTMTYVSAGHEPPVVCNTDDTLEELEVTGAMLGIIPGAVYTECERDLRKGESVVMFTDGITEARRGENELFDKTGVIEHLSHVCGARPDEIAEALLEAAVIHAEGNLQDDAAIVVLEFEE